MKSYLQQKTKVNPTEYTTPTKEWISYTGAQVKSFERGDRTKDDFYVVKQHTFEGGFTNTYNSFSNIEAFIKFEKGWEVEKTFNELIRTDTVCKEYYDIDGLWRDGWESIHDCLLTFLRLRTDFAEHSTINKQQIRWDDLIVTEACNDKKLSLHIIINQPKHFKNTNDQRIWASEFSQWIKEYHPNSKLQLDLSVYNNNSIMRCVGSTKVGDEKRPFKPYGLSKKITDKRLFYCSYVEKFYGVVGQITYNGMSIDIPQEKKKEVVNVYPKLTNEEEYRTCKVIIEQLKPERADNYNDWFAVGSALYNTLEGSKEGLELFLLFSQKCEDKYDENHCIQKWSKMEGSTYSKGTLIHMFNKDKTYIPNKRFRK